MKQSTLAIFAGTIISLILFWLMQAMISNNQPPKKEDSLQMTEFIKLKDIDKEIKKERKLKPKDELPPPPPPPQEQPQQKIAQLATPEMEIPELETPQPDLLTNSDIKLAVIKPKPKPKPKIKLTPKPRVKPKIKPRVKPKVKPRFKPRFKAKPKIKRVSKPKVQAIKAPVKVAKTTPKKVAKAAPKKVKVYSPVTSPKPRKVIRKKPVKKAAPRMSNRVSSNVSATYRAPVKYPKRAANRRQQGWVKVQFIITASGRVTSPFVVGSSPSGVFNRAALKSIRRWKFRPKVVNGQRVAQKAVQTIKFRLR